MEENERNRHITSLNDDPELSQFLEDERFAILLQNEEFVRELRSNRDFVSTLNSEAQFHSEWVLKDFNYYSNDLITLFLARA